MSEEIKKEVQDVELNLEELGGVAGGLLVDLGFTDYLVVDDTTGEVLDEEFGKKWAVAAANSHNVSSETIKPEEYKKRFGKEIEVPYFS